MSGYSLEIEFPDQSPSFAYGFEAGRIYGALKRGETFTHEFLNEENVDLVSQMGTRLGFIISFMPLGDGWVQFTATKR